MSRAQRTYLGERYRRVVSCLGLVTAGCGTLMLLPLFGLCWWPGEWRDGLAFLVPGVAMLGGGGILWQRWSGEARSLTRHDGAVVILAGWAAVCLFSAIPFVATGLLRPIPALFESVSGWSTTGLSVVDVESATHLILLWRSVMQLAGGAGLAILMLSVFTGAAGLGLAAAEGRSDQLVPNLEKSARLVLVLYGGYALAGVFAYRLAGMSGFDAVNHACAAVSTGGFSTHSQSIGYWDSPAIESITIPLMILGNLNFATAWLLATGRWRAFLRNGEVQVMSIALAVAALLAFRFTCYGLYPSDLKAVRVALFETVTALTTTGFSTVGYQPWNGFGIGLLILLMAIGGGVCSTAGGLKQLRVYLLLRLLASEVARSLLPDRAIQARQFWEADRQVRLDDRRVGQMAAYVTAYAVVLLAGIGVIAACGYSLPDAIFEMTSALSTIGLSVGVTSPTAPTAVLLAETAGMFLGRLEILVVIVGAIRLAQDFRIWRHS